MRITPLAVWLSDITDIKQIKKAVVADVELTHPDKLVHDAIFIYCIAIRYLLKKSYVLDRAQKVYDLALETAQSDLGNFVDEYGQSCNKWLQLSK